MPFQNNVLAGASAQGGYQIQNSLRFRASNSAYLNRTPSSAGNRKTWTWSAWVKRGALSGATSMSMFVCNRAAAADSTYSSIQWSNTNNFVFSGYATNWRWTNAVFRDPSAWYHLVVALDTTQSTAANRVKMYVNGVEQTSFTYSSDPALNADLGINQAALHSLGQDVSGGPAFFDGYMANVYFIDGQQLTPSSFGQTDAATGVWIPKAYSGTYGTNGFFLAFKDATSTTTIGYDTSGNSNNFTTSGISVTSGVTFDQSLDTPTNNYAVMNPLDLSGTAATFQWGNLQVTRSGASFAQAYSSIAMTSGKWYFEMTAGADVANLDAGLITGTTNPAANRYLGQDAYTYAYAPSGQKLNNATSSAYGNSWTSGDVIGVILDADAGKLWFSKNGTVQASGDPVAGTNAAFTGLTGPYRFAVDVENGGICDVNFGQRAFAYTPPTGFKALNTANLPAPTIKKPSLYMDATLRTGTGATASVSSLGFQPDLVWTKSRSAATNHNLFDSVRGAQNGIVSNSTAIEYADANTLTAFNSNGYTYGSDASSRGVNINTNTYVDWTWKKGVTPGFDIVTWTANGTSPRTISHSLGAVPKFIITKQRSPSADNWFTYHASLGATKNVRLDEFAAAQTQTGAWNDTAPTSTQFTTGSFANFTTNNNSLVAYLWAEIDGYSKFGSYTGNAAADGPFVWCGFRPRWIMIKDATTASLGWRIYDTVRETYNAMGGGLEAADAAAENYATSVRAIDVLSNGFKIRVSASGLNGSGATFIFAAFAETPFKYATAR